MATTYTVESRDHNSECGHHHKSIEAAHRCGERLYDAHYVGSNGQRIRSGMGGTWQGCAKWHCYGVIDDATGQSFPHGEW